MSLPPTYHSTQSNLSSVPTSPLKLFWPRSPTICKLPNLILWYSFCLILDHFLNFFLVVSGIELTCGFPSSSLAFPSRHPLWAQLFYLYILEISWLGFSEKQTKGRRLHAGDVLESTCRTHTAERVTDAGYGRENGIQWKPHQPYKEFCS